MKGEWENSKTLFFRSLMKLQSEELQIHAEELSKVWQDFDEERETRFKLEKYIVNMSNTLEYQVFLTSFLRLYFFTYLLQIQSCQCEKLDKVKTVNWRIVDLLERLTTVSSKQEKGLRKLGQNLVTQFAQENNRTQWAQKYVKFLFF